MLGIDLGANKVLGVKVKKGKVTRRVKITLKSKTKDEIVSAIDSLIDQLGKGEKAVGIDIPGIHQKGKILKTPNLPSLNGFDLKKEIEKKWNKAVVVENDANCFAYGEAIRRKKKFLVGITIGSGLGGGIVIDGKIYHGKRDVGEFGHMTIFVNGRKCTCGNRGCWEMYVSEKGFKIESKRIFGRSLPPLEVFNLANQGNKKALLIFEKIGSYLGVGLANIANILNPEIIVIGGGISKSKKFLLPPALKEMRKRLMVSEPKIVVGRYDSAAYGAALLTKFFKV